MKKTTLFTALALLAASMMLTGCKKDQDGFFRLKTQGYSDGSKTTISNSSTLWSDNDVLYINGTAQGNTTTVVEDNGSYMAVKPENVSNNDNKLVCFPGMNAGVANTTTYSQNAYTVTFPDNISVSGAVLNAPMMGYAAAQENLITFTNVCTVLKLEFPTNALSSTARTITIEDLDGTPLTGAFTYTYSDNHWTYTSNAGTDGSNTLHISSMDKTIYVPIPAKPNCSESEAFNRRLRISHDYVVMTMSLPARMEAGHIYFIETGVITLPTDNNGGKRILRFAPSNLAWGALPQGTPPEYYSAYNLLMARDVHFTTPDNPGTAVANTDIIFRKNPLDVHVTFDDVSDYLIGGYSGTDYIELYDENMIKKNYRLPTYTEMDSITKGYPGRCELRYMYMHTPTNDGSAYNHNGMMIFPDDFQWNLAFESSDQSTWFNKDNVGYYQITNNDMWISLLQSGGVFLPKVGWFQHEYFNPTSPYYHMQWHHYTLQDYNTAGCYWTYDPEHPNRQLYQYRFTGSETPSTTIFAPQTYEYDTYKTNPETGEVLTDPETGEPVVDRHNIQKEDRGYSVRLIEDRRQH